MRIAVLVKEVPDSYGTRVLDTTTGLADRAANEPVLDEITARALEVAVSAAEAAEGVEVVLMTMGPESAESMLRKALAMGGDGAYHVLDETAGGADLGLTAEILAAALTRVDCDLVICGDVSSDGAGGLLPTMIAQRLGVAHMTSLDALEISSTEVSGERASYGGVVTLRAGLPAVVSVTERLPDPRFPGFKGIISAKKKPIETFSLEDLGIDAGADVPRSIMLSVTEVEARAAGVKMTDEGQAAGQLVDYLAEKGLV